MSLLYEASTWVVPVVIAVTFHEVAHGFVAERFGDPTARLAGRLSLNPLKHIDRFGTIILPALLLLPRVLYGVAGPVIGYAKPVPVDFTRLHKPLRDMVWVALAGPVTNLVLATLAAVLFYAVLLLPGGHEVLQTGVFPENTAGWVGANLAHAIDVNVVLCCFNMLPLPPLDGGRVAVGLLPRPIAIRLARLERYGFLIILALLLVVPWLTAQLGYEINLIQWVVGVPAQQLIHLLLWITGLG